MERIVLAYSGGLATSAAIPWLADTYAAEVITVTVDLGQGRELEEVRDRALATGALRAHVFDERDAFARDVATADQSPRELHVLVGTACGSGRLIFHSDSKIQDQPPATADGSDLDVENR